MREVGQIGKARLGKERMVEKEGLAQNMKEMKFVLIGMTPILPRRSVAGRGLQGTREAPKGGRFRMKGGFSGDERQEMES